MVKIIQLLRKFEIFFVSNYIEMPSLSCEHVDIDYVLNKQFKQPLDKETLYFFLFQKAFGIEQHKSVSI